MSSTLEADGIELSFGERKILKGVYLRADTGMITGLLGRNGSGKSSLLDLCFGSRKPQGGSIRIDGRPLARPFCQDGLISYLPQFHFIPANLHVKRVFDDFELPLDGFLQHFPDFNQVNGRVRQLSGGWRRLLEVYLIIARKSTFTLLDEPFSQLMPLHVDAVCDLLAGARANKGVLLTDHLFQRVTDVSDRLYLLDSGRASVLDDAAALSESAYLKPIT